MKSEYEQVRFTTDLTLGELPEEFGIVTACNPNGTIVHSETNLARHRLLERHLQGKQLEYFGIDGVSPDLSHMEPGFGCVASEEIILELGQTFDQEAVFFVRGNMLWLINCQDHGDRVDLGHISERLL